MRLVLKRVAMIAVILIITLSIWYSYSSGYRFSPEAAMAHFDIEKSATQFGEVNFQWGKVYLFNTSKGPRTVLVTKEGFLWQAPAAVELSNSSDNVKTVGWMSYNGNKAQAMVFAVETLDPTVSYIQVGPAKDRIKKEITVKAPVVFSWNKVIDINNLNPVALSKDGTVLYEYRYPKNTITVSSEDLKWYPVSGSK